MNAFVNNPAATLHARVQLLEQSIPGSQFAGTVYDREAGSIQVHTGRLSELAQFMAKPFTAEERQELGQMVKHAADQAALHDVGPQQALNAMRVTTVDNFLRASGNWANLFFEEEVLAADERPVFKHTLQKEVPVTFIDEGGEPQTVKAVHAQKEVYPDLKIHSSKKVEYPVWDLYNGEVDEMAQRTFDIAYDLNAQIEATAKTLLDTAFGAFNQGSVDLDETFLLNSHIVSSNLPSTNELVAANNGADTKMRFDVLDAVEGYCGQWAQVFPDGPLAPTGVVIIPSIAVIDMLSQINATSQVSNVVADSVLKNYLQFTYAGRSWVLIPDATLDPKLVYPILNKKLGKKYTKPTFDAEYVLPADPAERMRKNKEQRYQTKVCSFAFAEPYKVNVCRVRYQDA